LLPAAALAGVLVAATLATLLGLLHRPAGQGPRAATGTVVESATCAEAGARDTVVFVVDGWSYRLPLDACGNPEGIQLDVELMTGDGGTPLVRLAGAGAAPQRVAAERVGALLLVLSGLSGALLAVLAMAPKSLAKGPRASTIRTHEVPTR